MLFNFAFFPFFVYLLTSFIQEKSHNNLSVFEEGAIKHSLGAKLWLYGFTESVFWQVLTDFLFVVYLLFFLQQHKQCNTDSC